MTYLFWISSSFILIFHNFINLPLLLYFILDVNWGSTTQAQIYKNALQAVHQLNSVEEHVKNYRPQILVLSGMPSARPVLVDFAHLLTKNLSMLVCGDIKTVRSISIFLLFCFECFHRFSSIFVFIVEFRNLFLQDPLPQRVRNVLYYKANSWLRAHKLKAFYMQVDGLSFESGAKALLKACGIGKLRPNILLMGFKSDWQTCPPSDLNQYFEVLQ